jgi:tripartite-type tricarboxylate transporter receptor subunit TctC
MDHLHRKFLRVVWMTAAVSLAGLSGNSAWSQEARTVKVVVPFGAGSSMDIVARLLAEQFRQMHGPTVVIENRTGAGTIVATDSVAGAAPDGNILLLVGNPLVINPYLRKVTYDPLTSFEPICNLVKVPTVIVVNSASPYHTLADLLDAAHARPGEVSVAGVGPGTATQVAVEVLKRAAGADMTFVSFSGTPQMMATLMGEHVTSVFTGYPDVFEQLNSGKLRALAVASLSRIEPLTHVPTVAESGYKGYELEYWYGVVAPAKTPKDKVAQLIDLFTTALRAPKTKAELIAQGYFPLGKCGADFGNFIRREYGDYGRIIRESNIKVE